MSMNLNQFFQELLSGREIHPGRRIDEYYSSWAITNQIDPMLRQFELWTQHSPFNDQCPKRRKYFLFGPNDRALCGCVPLAISKIFSYFEGPFNLIADGFPVDLAELKNYYYPEDFSENAKRSIAYLLSYIGGHSGSIYLHPTYGTFTYPKNAASVMRSVGYRDAKTIGYNIETVKTMLSNNKPVIIYGMPGINIFNTHCWNIDGYRVKERTKTQKIFEDGNLIETYTWNQKSEMVHCDFGWGGGANGYYVPGIFDTTDSNVIFDFGRSSKDHHYNSYMHLITY